MTYYMKMCSFSRTNLYPSYLYPCMECKYQFDPVGCRAIRKKLYGKIVYVMISDRLVDIPLCDYLGCEKNE